MQKRFALLLVIITNTMSISSAVALPEEDAAMKADVPSEVLSMGVQSSGVLTKADSLYAARQYTQAFDLYNTLYDHGLYSSAMLLKMAHIQEGLNHLGESLFYLNIYFLASDDHQALKKMEELAKKNNLEGYETSETTKIMAWFQEQYTSLTLAIASMATFLFAWMFYQFKKKHVKLFYLVTLLLAVLSILFAHVNFSKKYSRGIVADAQTYLMSGPSGGASVIAIIGEGHQLEIEGKKDVWLRVRWREHDAWIRENKVRTIQL